MPLIHQATGAPIHSPPMMPKSPQTQHAALPSHVSPALEPVPSSKHHHDPSSYFLQPPTSDPESHSNEEPGTPRAPPGSLISPAFTPPATPGLQTPSLRPAKSIPVDSSTFDTPGPTLVETLPAVQCMVRARIPTTTGQELWLHAYQNDVDDKEHLAIVFGSNIRSKSLDAEWPGETEMSRMVRGAYTGRLHPGRTHSRIDAIRRDAGVPTTSSGSLSSIVEDWRLEESAPAQRMQAREEPPLVRIHSECYTGETVWSARCDCGEQLDEAARLMSLPTSAGMPGPGGVIIYLRQEGRGIGLSEKLKAYNLQDLGNDTYEANLLLRHPADARSYGLATSMLVDLGLGGETGIQLLTNNPHKVRAVEGPQREILVKERVAMVPRSWRTGGREGVRGEEVERYLSTKIEKFKHMIGS